MKCIEEKSAKPNVRVGVDFSAYTDSTNVHVLTPAINGAIVSPTQGWNLGGSYLLDVVTAASPDLVSQASRRFREERHAASLNGGYKVGPVGLSANSNVSREPDYLSTTGGAAVSLDLNEKLITPRIGYNFSYDRIGMRDSPYANFERNLTTHEAEAGVTLVLSPTTLLVLGGTGQFERGENSKLYRFVPMFSEQNVGEIGPGESYSSVNALRLNVRPREVVPRRRDRYAVGARINHRLANGTIRVEQRLYADTWGIKASTTDARYLHDLGEHLRVWPHLRLHGQTGANFYELAYVGDTSSGELQTFPYRTGDRELSRMFTVTLGGGARYELSAEKATTKWAVFTSGQVMLSKYIQSLYITSRTALYGTLGLEVEL